MPTMLPCGGVKSAKHLTVSLSKAPVSMLFKYYMIHPFLVHKHLSCLQSPIPADIVPTAGFTLNRSPIHRRATIYRDRQPVTQTFTHIGNLELPI